MRVYADTSVFGGTRDDIFEAGSNAFFEQPTSRIAISRR
jgi:hypothetical protein